jgi:lipopolysaccharide export system protein LptC
MNGALSAHRFQLGVVIAIAAVLALGSFWLLEVMRKQIADSTADGPRQEPDYFVEKFNFVRMSVGGQAQYNISGKRLEHNPADDTHAIKLPVVNSLSAERPPMVAHSERALINSDNSKVHMYDNVHIDRAATATSEHFHLKSEYLLILPDDDMVQTDKPVEITLGASRLSGTGMVANNATRVLHLSSNVHATYPPPAPDAPAAPAAR